MKNIYKKGSFKKAFAAFVGLCAPLLPLSAAAEGTAYYSNGYQINGGYNVYSYIDMGSTVSLLSRQGYPGDHAAIPAEIDGKKTVSVGSSNFSSDNCFYYNTFFEYPDSLKSAEIPEGCEKIVGPVFANCTALAEVKLPSSLASIGEGAFCGCGVLRELEIPEKVTAVGSCAFAKSGLQSVALPEGVEKIEYKAFGGCESLSEAVLPDSIRTISNSAFSDCISLSEIEIPPNTSYIGCEAFAGSGLRSAELPDSVAAIGKGAFKNCAYLQSVKLPDGIIVIDDEAFQNCAALESVVFPDSVKSLGKDLFAGCKSLKSIFIPESVESLGNLRLTDTGPVNISFGGSWEQWLSLIAGVPEDESDLWKINIGCDIPSPLGSEEKDKATEEEKDRLPAAAAIAAAVVVFIWFIADFTLFKRVRRRTKPAGTFSKGDNNGELTEAAETYRFRQLGEWTCQKCGAVNGSIGKYCFNCGKKKTGGKKQ